MQRQFYKLVLTVSISMADYFLTSSTRLTPSGPRRLGDEYQDVQALDRMVEWLEKHEAFDWLKIEAGEKSFLDDVQAMRSNGDLELWQVKYSTRALTADDAWTWDALLKRESGARGLKNSLLKRWFESWKQAKQAGDPSLKISPALVSNRHAAPEIEAILDEKEMARWDGIEASVRDEIIAQLGDEDEARAFFSVFRFRVNQPGLRELRDAVYARFERMSGTPAGWSRLEKMVRLWAQSQEHPTPNGRILLDDIRQVCGLKVRPVRLKTFLPPSVYFEKYLNPDHLFFHGYPLVGRRSQLRELQAFLRGNKQIGILSARGGSGKSKLLQGFCARLVRSNQDEAVRLVAENLPLTVESLEEIPDEQCLIIVDDAHNRMGLEVLLQAALQNKETKVLLVTRPHAVEYLSSLMHAAGFDGQQIEQFPALPNLSYPRELQRLAKIVLGREWAHYSDDLASVTRDCPLLTVLGGRLLRKKQVPPALLAQENDFRRAVLEKFRDIRLGEIAKLLSPQVTPEFCADLLPWIAVASPLNCDHKALVEAIAGELKVKSPRLLATLDQLVNAGVLMRGGKLVRIVPDVLSDYILHEACLTSDNSPTGWAEQAFETLGDVALESVLRNLAELDWRVRSGVGQEITRANNESPLLHCVWDDIEQRFKEGDASERVGWLRRFERFSYMQPARLWRLVEIAVQNPSVEQETETPDESHLFDARFFARKATQETVLAALPAVIRGIACDERYIAQCAHLLWKLARDQETQSDNITTTTALSTLRQLAAYEHGKPYAFNCIILDCCREWMRDPKRDSYRQSVLTVLQPMLQRRIDDIHGDGRLVSYATYIVSPESAGDLRRDVLDLVNTFALSSRRDLVFQSLQVLSLAIEDRELHENPRRDEWDMEQLAAIEIVEKVATSNPDVFVRLKIWDTLYHQAAHSSRPAIRARCREVLSLVSHDFWGKFVLVLCGQHGYGNYAAFWPEAGADRFEEDEGLEINSKRARRNQARAEAIEREVVAGWVERFPDPAIAFEMLNEWIEKNRESAWNKISGIWLRGNYFFVRLALDFPAIATEFCELALLHPDTSVASRCPDFLRTLRRQSPEPTISLCHRFLESGNDALALAVAQTYSWNGWPLTPTPAERQIFESLLSHTDAQVRAEAVSILRIVAQTDVPRALDLMMGVEITGDAELPEKLFETFSKHGGIPFSVLTPEQITVLLDKLRDLTSLDGRHVGRFLSEALLLNL